MTPFALGVAVAAALLLGSGIGLLLRTACTAAGALFALTGTSAFGLVYLIYAAPASGGAIAAEIVVIIVLGFATISFPRFTADIATLLALGCLVVTAILEILSVTTPGPHPREDESLWVAIVPTILVLGFLWWRLESASSVVRRQVTWVLITYLTPNVAAVVLGMGGAPNAVIAAALASVGLTGVSALVAMTAPTIADVRRVTSLAVAATVAGFVSFIAYQLVVYTAEAVTHTTVAATNSGLAVMLAAVVFEPVRRVVALVADEALFGARPDALVAARQVALAVGDDPAAALNGIRTSLALPYAALNVDGETVAESGQPVEDYSRLPLQLDGESVGEVIVGLRPGEVMLPDSHAKVLALAAPLLAATVRAQALAHSLQEAREVAVSAREEERLRLRRDLHDGLGPRLSGIGFTADAARIANASEPVDGLLARIREETATAIKEIRGIVYGLRPPALDEVGLVESIRLQAANLALKVTVTASDLPVLPAAVEVAAYRIAIEALTNSARHSGSDRAQLEITADRDALQIQVSDEGTASTDWTPGVGLTSMRERAQELGGTLSIVDGTIRADLPLLR